MRIHASPPWFIGEKRRGRTLGKGYAIIKVRCNWEHPGETHWELGEHHGKLIGNLENIRVCLRTKVLAQHVCIVCSAW